MKTTPYFTFTLLMLILFMFTPISFAQDASPEYVVRTFYFYPSDRQPSEVIEMKLTTIAKDVQQFYADEMERHGFGRKTFRLETDENGNTVLHRVRGELTSSHYYWEEWRAFDEINTHFGSPHRVIHLIFVDDIDSKISVSLVGGRGWGNPFEGEALTKFINFDKATASEHRNARNVTAHELGHAFGLLHDYRDERDIMYTTRFVGQLSLCAAEWLDANRYFNTTQSLFAEVPTIRMLEPMLVAAPNSLRLQFEITHTANLHQAQLLRYTVLPRAAFPILLDCKSLSGNSDTIEFNTTDFLPYNEFVALKVIDEHGNFTRQEFPIDMTALLPAPEPISIPDANLEAVIRELPDFPQDRPITNLDMLNVLHIGGSKIQITDLTGLEHAIYMEQVTFFDNQIVDLTPLTKLKEIKILGLHANQISDINPLTDLTQLKRLWISDNQISDIQPLANLIRLEQLNINNNQISNIQPLAELTALKILDLSEYQKLDSPRTKGQISDVRPLANLVNLEILHLANNKISDVRPLVNLVNLKELYLVGNPIKDRKPLLALLRKNPNVKIYLKSWHDPLPVTLSHFRADHTDAGVVLNWTTESELNNVGFNILRSRTKTGEFVQVNTKLIQGAGTTGQRTEYTWTDTTAKPNTVYYYQIEDVSHAGQRKRLATVRLKGLVSARGKLMTKWADLK